MAKDSEQKRYQRKDRVDSVKSSDLKRHSVRGEIKNHSALKKHQPPNMPSQVTISSFFFLGTNILGPFTRLGVKICSRA